MNKSKRFAVSAKPRIPKEELERLLKYHPPELPRGPSSTLLPRAELGLAGMRLEVEELLKTSCGPNRQEKVLALGENVAEVLLRIASADSGCTCCNHVRSGAIALLGQVRHKQAAHTLESIFADATENLSIRCQAAVAAGRQETTSSIEKLSALLGTAKEGVLRYAAAYGLGESRSLMALPALEQAVMKEKDAHVKWRAFASIRGLEKWHGGRLAHVKSPPIPRGGKPTPVKIPRSR